MAIIPTYQRQVSVPGTTGQQMAPLSLANNGMVEAAAKVSGELIAAAERIQRREDTINRVRDFEQFQTAVSTEWQRINDQEDISRPETLKKFNEFVSTQRANVLKNHAGSADSMALLDAASIDVASQYERTAIGAMREGQIKILKDQYGNQLNPILAGVRDGTMSVEDAFGKVNALSAELGGTEETGWVLPRQVAFDLHDAAQSAIAEASIDKHLAIGDWQGAQAVINAHPEFATVMDVGKMQQVIARIDNQRVANDMINAKVVAERNQKAVDWGFKSWAQVPQSWKIYGPPARPEPYKPQTDAAKAVMDRAALARLYGDNSPAVRQFDALQGGAAAAMSSEIGKMQSDMARLQAQGKGPGDPTYDALANTVNAKNPEYVKQQEKVQKFPAAQMAFDTFTRQAQSMRDDAKRAIMLWTGKDNIDDAMKAAADENYAFGTSGVGAMALGQVPGSSINEINAIMHRIGGNQMLAALQALKAASPTGASGMGALNETEGKALMFQEGALDIKAPQSSINTLMGIIQNTDKAIASQKTAFDTAFGAVPGTPGGQDMKQEAPKPSGAAPMFDLNGDPIR